MKEKFDYDAFDEKVQQNYEEYEGELQHTNDKKGIALLQTNYFQSCLKDAMESILHSSKARKIPIKLIVSVFEETGVLTNEDASRALKICEIRDWFAHRVNLKSIEEDSKKLIQDITIDAPHMDLVWGGLDFELELMKDDEESTYWDSYQKLDFICMDLGMKLKHEALYHSNRPRLSV